MRISSTRRPATPKASHAPEPPKDEKGNLLSKIPLNEATVEIPETLLHLSGLQESHPTLGNGLRLGIGGMALAKAVQAFQSGEGVHGKLEGISSLALAVAGGASVFNGHAAGTIGHVGESVHGVCEMALGVSELRNAMSHKEGCSAQFASGLLGFAKGALTFLPMIAPGTEQAVGFAHLGILTGKVALQHASTNHQQHTFYFSA